MILAYHGIAARAPDPDGLSVNREDFHAQMAHIRAAYRPMSLDALVAAAAGGEIPTGAIAVTLDDGYLDALEIASPILVECGIPATFFVTTGHLDARGEFWWDTLARIFASEHPVPPTVDLPIEGQPWRAPTRTRTERARARVILSERMIRMSYDERESTLVHLVAWHGREVSRRPDHRPMLAGEVAQLATRPGHAIGAHGIHHLCLPAQPLEVQLRETHESKARLEALLGHPVAAFAYPYGACDAATMEIVRAAGFELAVTVARRRFAPRPDPMCLSRHEIRAGDSAQFPAILRDVIHR